MERLDDFETILNNMNYNIQLTMEHSNKQLTFLDILIKVLENNIETDFLINLQTPNNTYYLIIAFLNSQRLNIPYNPSNIICTLVSNTNTRDQRLCILQSILIRSHYLISLISVCIRIAKEIHRQKLREVNRNLRQDSEILPYISTHNLRNNGAFNTTIYNLPILKTD